MFWLLSLECPHVYFQIIEVACTFFQQCGKLGICRHSQCFILACYPFQIIRVLFFSLRQHFQIRVFFFLATGRKAYPVYFLLLRFYLFFKLARSLSEPAFLYSSCNRANSFSAASTLPAIIFPAWLPICANICFSCWVKLTCRLISLLYSASAFVKASSASFHVSLFPIPYLSVLLHTRPYMYLFGNVCFWGCVQLVLRFYYCLVLFYRKFACSGGFSPQHHRFYKFGTITN